MVKKYFCLGEKDLRDYLKVVGVKVIDKGKSFKNWVRLGKKYVFSFKVNLFCGVFYFN